MPAEAMIWIVAVVAMFTTFMVGVGYVSVVATARALTPEEEQATRKPTNRKTEPTYSDPLKQAA